MEKENKGINVMNKLMGVLVLASSSVYLAYIVKNMYDKVNGMSLLIGALILELFSLLFFLTSLVKNKVKNALNIFSSLAFISFITFTVLDYNNIIKIKKMDTLPNFINKNIADVVVYADEKKLDIDYSYEYSDNVEEGKIISQDVLPGTILKKIDKVSFVVSGGPNYDKEIILTNFEGTKIDELIDFISKNYLNNVNIIYEINNEIERDIIISQSVKGNTKRSSLITVKVSLGSKDSLSPISLEDLRDKKLFDATLYLKRNGISYELKYEFSDTINKDHIISTDPSSGEVTPLFSKVILTVSKGKSITVPNLKDMEMKDIVSWASENNVKLSFNEEYHKDIKLGQIISVSEKENNIIAEGTNITITTSKGPLRLINTHNLTEFKTWADKYKVDYSIKYEYSDTVSKGTIIKYSIEIDSIIDFDNSITVTVSNGKSITVPNFVGMSKYNITTTCKNLGLNCTFYYTGYSSTAKDIAKSQNVKAKTVVMSGTYVSIGLSSGPAKTYNVYIQSEWYGRTADATISTLKQKLSVECPGVIFKFEKRSSNTGAGAGYIHESSPTRGGQNSFTQGKTYTFYIIN
ncbi:MAG: PASTA domain-containing protein [Bacillales bacterium]|nr:PASTA domain-containing protein [Bacillales bacterium]